MGKRILFLITISVLFFSVSSNAQTKLDEGINNVLSALNSSTSDFEELGAKINLLKKNALEIFQAEQVIIDKEEDRINRNQAGLDQDKSREPQMMYDEWVVRSKANEKLMRDKELLHEKKLALAMRKVVFKDKITQAEQKLISTMGNQMEEQMRYYNSRMKILKQQLKDVEF